MFACPPRGFLPCLARGQEGDASLDVLPGSAILVTVEVSHIVGPEVLYEFASKINLAQLEGQFEQK